MLMKTFIALGMVLVFSTALLHAQTETPGQLSVTVKDPSNALIVGATITLTGIDDGTRRTPAQSVPTTGPGVASFERLAPGRYRLRVEFSGFEPSLRDIRIRAGENRQTITLGLLGVSEVVNVGVDPVARAVDPRGGFYLTQEQIEVLPDDPLDMAQALMEMAGTRAIFTDGFRGGLLPPKSQIRSIHISRDAFAAEYHAPGGRVDVATKVGAGPVMGSLGYTASDATRSADGGFRFQGSSPDGKPRQFTPTASFNISAPALSPFAARVPESSGRRISGDLSGTIAPNKISFSMNASSDRSYREPLLNVALPSGNLAGVTEFKSRGDYDQLSATLNYSLVGDHAVRGQYSYFRDYETGGVGGYNLPGRAELWRDGTHTVRLQESGPVGKRGFINTRFEISFWCENYSAETEAPTTRVLDAFTSGGAQSTGGSDSRGFLLGSDFDYVRGRHALRTGFVIDADDNQSDYWSNYLGTYTFESLADYEAGRPRSFTRVVGDPHLDYWFLEAGVYVQDDMSLRKNLVLSPGLRYEAQSHLGDHANWAPRFGVNWSPGKPGGTQIRASWGLFYNWMGTGIYERTLRFDGEHQDEINIADPAYLAGPATGPSNRYRLSDDLRMPRISRFVVSLNQKLNSKMRLSVGYTGTRGSEQFRGNNVNAPIGGVRPDSSLANVIEVVSDARLAWNQYNASLNVNFAGVSPAGPSPAPAPGRQVKPKLVDWHRLNFNVDYAFNDQWNNFAGAFEVPPGGNLDSEWSRASTPRHQANFGVNSTVLRNLTVTLNGNWQAQTPYTLYTGVDTNGDLIFNDRPSGIRRNTERSDDLLTLRAQARYVISGGPTPGAAGAVRSGRPYRVEVSVRVMNLTNRRNYIGYSGVMTSPFFHAPTAVVMNGAFVPRVVTGAVSLSF